MSAEHSEAARQPVQLLVVGAGPVGLLAALTAARRRLTVEILDESPRSAARGHATILHASSIRLLDGLGLAEGVLGSGQRLDRVALFVGGTRAATLELPSPAFAVPQATLEESLRRALQNEGAAIGSARQATTIAESDGRAHVRVVRWELPPSRAGARDDDWQPASSSVLDADFIIGADGRNSRVRTSLGIEMVDLGRPVCFAMFELPSSGDPGTEVILAFTEGLATAMIPLPRGRIRWGFQLETPTTEKLYATELEALLARRAPWYRGAVDRIDWGSVVRFERRLARRFGKGRAWLAGDAAHGTSPLGGQSMNLGLLEADHLVRRIVELVAGGEHPSVLEEYGTASQRQWHKLLGFNVSLDLLPHAPSWLAEHARQILPALPASGMDFESLLTALGLVIR